MNKTPLIYILISAAFFGISPPVAKLLVRDIQPIPLAGLLYLGAFLGLSVYYLLRQALSKNGAAAAQLGRTDIPWLFGAILCGGIIAPICLMFGLRITSGFSTSLFLNLEGVATAVIAVLVFRENAGNRLWLALSCMSVSGLFLAWDPNIGEFKVLGPILIVMAMVCWGIDNNLTRQISDKNPIQTALIKGLIAGTVSLSLAYVLGMKIPFNENTVFALVLGSFSYGVSLVFFIKALERLGSFRTGIFFNLAPFIGAAISLLLLREWLGWIMLPATAFMIAGYWLMVGESHSHIHVHKVLTHTHLHDHKGLHHRHMHSNGQEGPHIHEHTHGQETHSHAHWPDSHHRHLHDI